MTTKSATVAPEGKRYKYYGLEYRMSVKDMAAASKVSLRFQKEEQFDRLLPLLLYLHGLSSTAAGAETAWDGVSGYNRSGVHDEAVLRPRWRQAHAQGNGNHKIYPRVMLRGTPRPD